MNMSRIDLNLTHVFLALWHERSVSRAAMRLALTQPAVSSALKRLRQTCGDELFIRTRHGMQPTVHAIEIAETLELTAETLRSTLSARGTFNPASSPRSFIIGTDGGLDYTVGPRLASRLTEDAPDTTVTFRALSPATLDGALERREIDLALTVGGVTRPDYLSTSLGSFRFSCIWNPDYCSLPDLLDLPTIEKCRHVLIETALRHSTFDHRLRDMGVNRTIRNVVPSFGHLPAFLRQPETVAIVPDYIADFFRKTAGLTSSRLPDIFGTPGVRMLLPRKSSRDSGIKWLGDLIMEIGLTSSPDDASPTLTRGYS
ncbi:LysR family transcriptional regulator [Acetobacter sp. DsW_063]|uniref:LysR family transcriptional regulator n=1 Tax=Acetobacter sp. DsW_063 TaxID=1514894 RepID=UPI000A36AA8E|nr:LysR family transcriptional regulator [Acetobacter sp. DsW_063]